MLDDFGEVEQLGVLFFALPQHGDTYILVVGEMLCQTVNDDCILSDAPNIIDEFDHDLFLLNNGRGYLPAVVAIQPVDVVLDREQVRQDFRILRHELGPKYDVAAIRDLSQEFSRMSPDH